jgi:hypothetical protein
MLPLRIQFAGATCQRHARANQGVEEMKLLHSGAWLAVFAAGAFAVSAGANDAPKRKSGQWEISSAVGGQPPAAEKVCIDMGSDDVALSAGSGTPQEHCESATTKTEGDGFVTESVCKLRNSTVTSRGVFTGSLESAYKGEVETNYNPPMYGRAQVKTIIEAKWTGPCP